MVIADIQVLVFKKSFFLGDEQEGKCWKGSVSDNQTFLSEGFL
jgi:hypothetical protein